MRLHAKFTMPYNRHFALSVLRPSAAISFILLFFLSIDHLPLPIQAQIIPLSSILSMIFLLLLLILGKRIPVTPLLRIVMLFIGFVLLHSVVALLVDVFVFNGAGQIRVIAWGRQVIALGLGVSVFLVLRKTLKNVSDRFMIQAMVIGALLPLALALLNILWGFTGSTLASAIVIHIRSALGLSSWPHRTTGLSMEPSHFAFYLVIVAIPALFMGLVTSKRKLLWFMLLAGSLVAFVGTFSATGLIELLSLLLTWLLLSNRKYHFFNLILVALLLMIGVFAIYLLPNNYAVMQLEHVFSGNWTVSAIDRFYGAFGPFMRVFSSYTLLGYGLGGTSIHFHELMPENVQAIAASVHWETMPNLNSLIGRILAESGLLGLLLFSTIFYASFKEVKILIRNSKTGSVLAHMALPVLITFLVGATVGGHGSFALPYLWFWLAVIDSRYMNQKNTVR